MKQLLITLLLLPAVLCIYNGEEASASKFMVHIEITHSVNEEKTRHCGGTMYADNAVITSAQCVAPKGKRAPVDSLQMVLGAKDWTDKSEEGQIPLTAKRIITHQGYKGGAENDIALIIVEKAPIGEDSMVTLPDEGWHEGWDVEADVTVMGWGGTKAEEKGTNILHKIEYKVSDQDQCHEYWKLKGKPVMEGMFCTGNPEEDKHAWVGDEGGPAFWTNNNKIEQLGIVSWGSDRTIPRAYDVNTDLGTYKAWVESALSGGMMYPVIELVGGLSHGVVLVHMNENSEPTTICNHGAGQKEYESICKSLGYESGVARGSRDYAGKRSSKGFENMPEFGMTKLDCTEFESSFGECVSHLYPNEAEVPCFHGQELAVQCSSSEWEFEFTHMQTKTGDRGKAMCRLTAHKYGVEIDVKKVVTGTLLNVKESGVEVVQQMKYKKKQSTFVSRYKDLDHSCLVCVASINGAEDQFHTYMLEDESICKLDLETVGEKIKAWIENGGEREDDD